MALFGKPRQWFLYNLDTDEKLMGQFVAQDVSENLGAVYSERFALNRQHPITQWVHGEIETVSFRSMFYMTAELLEKENDPTVKLGLLKQWIRRDSKLKRPPLLSFWIGDAHLQMAECILERLSDIRYEAPTFSGALRQVSFGIQLKRWWPFDVEFTTSPGTGETRYHRAKFRSYYEMLAQQEYNSPDLGDVIRKRHPSKPVISTGDVIALPDLTVVSREVVEPKSLALKNAFDTGRVTVQRTRREAMFDARNESRTSHVVLNDGS